MWADLKETKNFFTFTNPWWKIFIFFAVLDVSLNSFLKLYPAGMLSFKTSPIIVEERPWRDLYISLAKV